jgi:gas vesicle protein
MMGEHEEQEQEQESESGSHAEERVGPAGFAAGLVVGALLGASVALLFAPERGDRTRRSVRRRLERLREEAAEGLGRAGRLTRKDVLRRRRHLRDRLEKALDRL